MTEYTVTYPVHLGQEVWVDARLLPPADGRYLKGEIRALIIQAKGDTARKSMKIKIDADWLVGGKHVLETKYLKIAISSIGKTVFLEEPEEIYAKII